MRISSQITHFDNLINQMIRYLLCELKLTRITQMSNTTTVAQSRTVAINWRLAACNAATRTSRDELRVRFQTGWIAGELTRQF